MNRPRRKIASRKINPTNSRESGAQDPCTIMVQVVQTLPETLVTLCQEPSFQRSAHVFAPSSRLAIPTPKRMACGTSELDQVTARRHSFLLRKQKYIALWYFMYTMAGRRWNILHRLERRCQMHNTPPSLILQTPPNYKSNP